MELTKYIKQHVDCSRENEEKLEFIDKLKEREKCVYKHVFLSKSDYKLPNTNFKDVVLETEYVENLCIIRDLCNKYNLELFGSLLIYLSTEERLDSETLKNIRDLIYVNGYFLNAAQVLYKNHKSEIKEIMTDGKTRKLIMTNEPIANVSDDMYNDIYLMRLGGDITPSEKYKEFIKEIAEQICEKFSKFIFHGSCIYNTLPLHVYESVTKDVDGVIEAIRKDVEVNRVCNSHFVQSLVEKYITSEDGFFNIFEHIKNESFREYIKSSFISTFKTFINDLIWIYE